MGLVGVVMKALVQSAAPGDEGDLPPPVDDGVRPIIVRIDDGATTWSWIGEPEQRITASAVDADGRVLFAAISQNDPSQGLTLTRLATDATGSTVTGLAGEGWAYDIAVHADADHVVVAGNDAAALGYWIADGGLQVVGPFAPLYEVALGDARVVRAALAADGSFVIAGAHADLETRWMKKIDAAGQIVWERDWPLTLVTLPALPSLADIALLADGSIVLAIPPADLGGPGYGVDVFDADGSGMWAWEANTTTVGGVASLGTSRFIVAGRDDASSNLALHAVDADGEAWSTTTDLTGIGPVHPCGNESVVVALIATAFLRAFVFDAEGTLVETVEHVEPDAETTADDAFCTRDGGVVIIGHLTPA